MMTDETRRHHNKRPRKSQRKEQQAARDLEEERLLAASLFGNASSTSGFYDESSSRRLEPYNENRKTSVGHGDVLRAPYAGSKNEKPTKTSRSLETTPEFSFEIDRVGDLAVTGDIALRGDEEEEAEATSSNQDTSGVGGDNADTAAWVDEDDEGVELSLVQDSSRLRKLRTERAQIAPLSGTALQERLRQRFTNTTQRTARTDWADITTATVVHKNKSKNHSEHEESNPLDDSFALQSTSMPLLASGGASQGRRLPPNVLNMKRCPDANLTDPCQAVVQAVHFHPASEPDAPLLLTAGLDKSLRFFQVREEGSTKIHGIHFPKMPIYSASFLGTSGTVVVTGRRPFFYLYDSVAGKVDLIPNITGRNEKSWERCVASPDGRTLALMGNDGYVVLYDAARKSWMADFKLNGSVRAVSFTPDGAEVVASGSDGDVYRWDLRSKKCLERFPNSDGTITSCLAVSQRTMAVGAESGVVNLYSETTAWRRPSVHGPNKTGGSQGVNVPSAVTPIKSIMNLKTSADLVRFNDTGGDILAMASRREKNALKLVHVPTRTVFRNWPTSQTPLGYVWSLDFSPESKFVAVGNDQGKCLLYKLMHYDSA